MSEPLKPKIRYSGHRKGFCQMKFLFGVKQSRLKHTRGLGWALEKITAITHTGTHVDAPFHYALTSEGKPARRIDEFPLDWCYGPGVRIDVCHLRDGDETTVAEIEKATSAINYELSGGEIVLFMTRADQRIDSRSYFE